MKIEVQQNGRLTMLRLEGRLDVVWAEHVASRARELIRSGHHNLRLDAAGLTYMSSAGIRTLILLHREVGNVAGSFFVVRPSEYIGNALRMSGLDALVAPSDSAPAASPSADRAEPELHLTPVEGMKVAAIPLDAQAVMHMRKVSGWIPWRKVVESDVQTLTLPDGCLALGIGAAGEDPAEGQCRFGEFLAVGGCMVVQPADNQPHSPDFIQQAGGFVPEIHAVQALVAEGAFSTLLRFGPSKERGRIGMSDLAALSLEATGAEATALVVLGEAEGVVGAALARSPAAIGPGEDPGQFPHVRQWMNFCGERVHSGCSVLVAGFVMRRGSWTDAEHPYFAGLPSRPELAAHLHAAAFPFRPLPEGAIRMDDRVKDLFSARDPLDLLHVLEDDRPVTGLGQSAFVRGACWCAPLVRPGGGEP